MADYSIREYESGDEQGILPSFNRVFRDVCGESYVDREMGFWNWQFLENPAGHRITLATTEDGTVAGHYAGVPQRFRTSYGDAHFVHIVDSFVLPEHRAGLKRPGLFVNTALPWFELCDRMQDAVLYGYPVPQAERIGQRFLGYETFRPVEYLVREFSAAPAESGSGSITVQVVDQVPSDMDALHEAFHEGRECALARDRAYLDWRYAKIPGGAETYRFVEARRDGVLVGFEVLRPVWELVPGSCWIAELITALGDDEARMALVAAADEVAKEAGRACVATFFPPWSVETEQLRGLGFEDKPSATWFERRLTHRIYHPQMSTPWLLDHWWYTLGDTDLV